jgi:hypothetical protein
LVKGPEGDTASGCFALLDVNEKHAFCIERLVESSAIPGDSESDIRLEVSKFATAAEAVEARAPLLEANSVSEVRE